MLKLKSVNQVNVFILHYISVQLVRTYTLMDTESNGNTTVILSGNQAASKMTKPLMLKDVSAETEEIFQD